MQIEREKLKFDSEEKERERQYNLRMKELEINFAKSEFCHAALTFLGHVVGHGQVKPIEAKVEAISDFPVSTCKRQLMMFLGMAVFFFCFFFFFFFCLFFGFFFFFRKFCYNFSVIAEPLTNLLSKRMRFKWTSDCQNALDKLKAILRSEPVLLATNFNKEFKLAVNASDVGAGGVCCKRMTMVWIIQFVTFSKSLTNIKRIILQ